MSDGRVYRVEEYDCWVAADDGGWLPGTFKTEAEAQAAIGLKKRAAVIAVDDYRADLRAKVSGLRDYMRIEGDGVDALVWRSEVLALIDGSGDD